MAFPVFRLGMNVYTRAYAGGNLIHSVLLFKVQVLISEGVYCDSWWKY